MGALAKAEDAGRIVQKFLLGRGDSSDLSTLNLTISMWAGLKDRVEQERRLEAKERDGLKTADWASLDALMARMIDLHDLSKRISMSIQFSHSDLSSPETPGLDENSAGESSALNARYGFNKWTINPQ